MVGCELKRISLLLKFASGCAGFALLLAGVATGCLAVLNYFKERLGSTEVLVWMGLSLLSAILSMLAGCLISILAHRYWPTPAEQMRNRAVAKSCFKFGSACILLSFVVMIVAVGPTTEQQDTTDEKNLLRSFSVAGAGLSVFGVTYAGLSLSGWLTGLRIRELLNPFAKYTIGIAANNVAQEFNPIEFTVQGMEFQPELLDATPIVDDEGRLSLLRLSVQPEGDETQVVSVLPATAEEVRSSLNAIEKTL